MSTHPTKFGYTPSIAAALGICAVACLLFFVFTRGATQATIQIGAVLPLTGSAAVWGQNAKMGMDLALEEINAKGGVGGHKIAILYEDSQSDAKTATSALQKLITLNGVQVVIGDISSSSVLAMAPIAERNQVVLLSPGASNPDISTAGKFIFRNWQSDNLEGTIDAHFAWSQLKWRRAACLYVKNAYGTGLTTVFAETFTSLGGEIVASEAFLQGTGNARSQITKVAATNPDGIFMPGYPPEMATVLKQMREMAVHSPILSVQAFDDPEIVERAGDATEGVTFSVPTPPDSADPIVATFRTRYRHAYGRDPGVTSDTGYDAVRIVIWAIDRGAHTGGEIQETLATLVDFPGAAGNTTFDQNGDVAKTFVFRRIQQGRAVDAGDP